MNSILASPNKPVVGRFAPSPTGPLHVGSLVAALGSFLFARQSGGSWLLRIEDIDTPRVVPGMADDMLRTLELLGLLWDGEVLYQSRRTEYYRAALEKLNSSGFIYPCGCSRTEIAHSASAPHGEDGAPLYPGLCRTGIPPGKTPRSLRIKVNNETISFRDGIMGYYSQSLAEACGDFILKRADGPFAYHLAVVVDDTATGVTQVVRGADLLSSTPRQIYLQQLLGYHVPDYFHLPLVTDPGGDKLSKRDNAVSLAVGRNLRLEGGSLIFAALRFLGQSPPESLTNASPAEILAWGVPNFTPAKIPRIPNQLIT